MPLSLKLENAEVLRPDGWTRDRLCFEGEHIVEGCDGRVVDLAGFRVLPGIVDLHGDGFEHHLAPRRGVMKDLRQGLASAEAELAANGITTAMLAQFWSWEGGMRSPEFAQRMLLALDSYEGLGTDLRVQLRFETHLLEDYGRITDLVLQHDIRFLVFNDHLPHAALAKGKRPPRLTGQALKSGRSPDQHLALLRRLHEQGPQVPEAIAGLAQTLSGQGVLMGSHDDRTPEGRAEWRHRGVVLSEFPETRAAAVAAAGAGDPVVLGAPNVVRGGSHSGNVSASALIAEGVGTALASDYHYPAPRLAALALERWDLVSSGPASVLGMTDRGTLMPGQRADIVVLDDAGRVGATIAGGRVTYLAGTAAHRFMA